MTDYTAQHQRRGKVTCGEGEGERAIKESNKQLKHFSNCTYSSKVVFIMAVVSHDQQVDEEVCVLKTDRLSVCHHQVCHTTLTSTWWDYLI